MKQILLLTATVLGFVGLTSCGQQKANNTPGADAVKTYVPNNAAAHSAGRMVTSGYSKNISLDSANRMISSYVISVGYPIVDSAVRSVAFDADSLRAYLSNPDITAVRFYFAHQLSYINGGADRFGKNIGMKPGALTVVMAGVDNNNTLVRNSSGGVYEHAMPCPNSCGNDVDGYLH